MTSAVGRGSAEASSKFCILLTALLVSSLIMLDSNIVAVSLPAIGQSLGASFVDVQWVISALPLAETCPSLDHEVWKEALSQGFAAILLLPRARLWVPSRSGKEDPF
jgi:MFS family permease